jgi:hypothetical protein
MVHVQWPRRHKCDGGPLTPRVNEDLQPQGGDRIKPWAAAHGTQPVNASRAPQGRHDESLDARCQNTNLTSASHTERANASRANASPADATTSRLADFGRLPFSRARGGRTLATGISPWYSNQRGPSPRGAAHSHRTQWIIPRDSCKMTLPNIRRTRIGQNS